MKTKIVLWGQKTNTDATTEKVIIALELIAENNKVNALIFEGDTATNEFADELMNKWRKGEAIVFPESFQQQTYELSAAGSLLPDGVQVEDKDDLVKRMQTEWLFIVLSTKLFKTYESELEQLQDRIEGLSKYNKGLWEEMKTFQSKVMAQVKEQNLFREHTNLLRDRINNLFGILKDLRRVEDEAFEKEAQSNYSVLEEKLLAVENALETDAGAWSKWFDQLKQMQSQLKKMKLIRDDRAKLWDRIDQAFKAVKVKRFGDNNAQGNRLERRMEGLEKAIKKMESSLARDEKELDFQNKKINSTNAGQLEAQLREVRAKMIVERIDSKKEKLADMLNTMKDLTSRHEKLQKRIEKEKVAQVAKETVVKVDNSIEETEKTELVTPREEIISDEKVDNIEETIVEGVSEQPKMEESKENIKEGSTSDIVEKVIENKTDPEVENDAE